MLATNTKVAPYAHLSDGYMDLLFSKKLNRTKVARLLLGMDEEGSVASLKDVEYHKVRTVTLEPKTDDGYIMIDGELYPQVTKFTLTVLPCAAKIFIGL